MSSEVRFHWYTRRVWESTFVVLLQPSAWCIVYASSERASRDTAARAVPVLTGRSADAAIPESAEVRTSGTHCAAPGAVLGAAARQGHPASCSAMSCRIRTLCEWWGGGFRHARARARRVLHPDRGQKPRADGHSRRGWSFSIGERVKDVRTECSPEVADLVSGAGLMASRVGTSSALAASFL